MRVWLRVKVWDRSLVNGMLLGYFRFGVPLHNQVEGVLRAAPQAARHTWVGVF